MVAPIPDPPEEPLTAQDWRMEGVEPFAPGEILSVFEAVMTFYDRSVVMTKPRHIEDIEHWIGKPYNCEQPDPLSVSTEELCPPETEDERVRRCSWACARDLLAALADGTLPTVPERQVGENPYAQVIRTTDFLRWGEARGGYDETFSELLRQREFHEPGAPNPAPAAAAPASIEQLAEWIFVRHSSPKPLSCDSLFALAVNSFDPLKKTDFLEAYRRVYDSCPWHPPATGWPLKAPYKDRWSREHS
jgi:hypothetical protein